MGDSDFSDDFVTQELWGESITYRRLSHFVIFYGIFLPASDLKKTGGKNAQIIWFLRSWKSNFIEENFKKGCVFWLKLRMQ